MAATTNLRVWLITGSSTGFGRALVEAVLQRGEIVVATARNPQQLKELEAQYPERVLATQLDVTKKEEVREVVNRAMPLATIEDGIATFGKIDVLVNNAGYGSLGAIEELSDALVRQQYEVNVFGVLDMTRAVLPHMRRQHSGHILNLSSVGGLVSFPGAGIYCSTRHLFAMMAASAIWATALS